jgi:DNA-binding SARP family transcriptional activator
LDLCLLGGFEVRIQPGGAPVPFPTRKSEALLAYLASHPGVPHRRDVTSSLLWGDVPDAQARHSLRQTLSEIRSALRAWHRPLIETEADSIRIATAGLRVDVQSFQVLARRGRTARAARMACTLYRGDFLAGLSVHESDFDTWLMAERARLKQLAIEAHEEYLRALIAAGESADAIETVLRLLALDQLQEWAHRELMQLYAQRGWFGLALEQYDRYEQLLADELGIQPEPETQDLRRRLLLSRTQPEREAVARHTPRPAGPKAATPREPQTEAAPPRDAPKAGQALDGDRDVPPRAAWHSRRNTNH